MKLQIQNPDNSALLFQNDGILTGIPLRHIRSTNPLTGCKSNTKYIIHQYRVRAGVLRVPQKRRIPESTVVYTTTSENQGVLLVYAEESRENVLEKFPVKNSEHPSQGSRGHKPGVPASSRVSAVTFKHREIKGGLFPGKQRTGPVKTETSTWMSGSGALGRDQ